MKYLYNQEKDIWAYKSIKEFKERNPGFLNDIMKFLSNSNIEPLLNLEEFDELARKYHWKFPSNAIEPLANLLSLCNIDFYLSFRPGPSLSNNTTAKDSCWEEVEKVGD